MRRRLLQGLEQRVEGPRRQHVDFVDDVDLVRPPDRRIAGVVAQLPHLVHLVVARTVDLDHVQRRPGGNLPARVALAARLRVRAPVLAVERLGHQPGRRRLAGATRPNQQIGVRHPPRQNRAGQRVDNMRLANDVPELLGTPLAGEDFVGHDGKPFAKRAGPTLRGHGAAYCSPAPRPRKADFFRHAQSLWVDRFWA